MVLLMVVVLVVGDVLALLALRPEIRAGDDKTESCADASEGHDEGDS